MSQDIISDGLNQIMNAKRVEKKELVIRRYSKVLLNLFEIMKSEGYIDYEVNKAELSVKVKIIKLNECRAIKPRYYVAVGNINKYLRRFLPSRNMGNMIVSTNKGLLGYKESLKENIGGSLIAYFY